MALLSRYSLAALLAGLAALASFVLSPHWSPRHLALPFYPAVMLSAWFGGVGPGVLTTVLSTLAIVYRHLPPPHSPMRLEPGDLMGFLLFLSVGVLISALHHQVMDAHGRADAVGRELEREVDERRTVEAVAAKLTTVADELQTSVERYRQQLGTLAGVFRAQWDGRLVECSEFFARLLGAASPEQVLGLSWRDLFLEPARWRELMSALAPGGMISNQELRWRGHDGARLTVLVSLREADGFVEGIAIDITDRKRLEESDRRPTRLRDMDDRTAAVRELRDPLAVVVATLSAIKLEGDLAVGVDKALEAARRAQEIVERLTRSNESR